MAAEKGCYRYKQAAVFRPKELHECWVLVHRERIDLSSPWSSLRFKNPKGFLVKESTYRQPSDLSRMTKATRLLCGMAIFAFAAFSLVDPLVADVYSLHLIWLRLTWIGIITGLLIGTRFVSTVSRMQHLGGLVSLTTGVGVVLLTEMTGGAASAYWTMLMPTFFATAGVLPMRPRWAVLYFVPSAVFYFVWLFLHDATSNLASWASSNAGIWLSLVVSVFGVGFIHRMRDRDVQHSEELERLNADLCIEIEQRREVNAKLLESQKLDAIGQLAAGVAHEMNNVLTAVSCTAENLRSRLEPHAEQSADLLRILKAAERGEKLTSDLLGFARKTPQSTRVLSFTQLVLSVADMVGRTHRGRITILTELDDEVFGVRGDERILFQAVLNLCLNGIDAMSNGDSLRLMTKSHSQMTEDGAREGVELSIEDSGIGMSHEQVARAFEPFYTTKAVGKGTGLGLSMVYGAVDDHGGDVTIDSAIGQGTTIRIWLPLSGEPLSIPQDSVDDEVNPTHIDGTVLVLDDDPLVREVTCQILRQVGVEVIEAADGREGLEKYRQLHDQISLVLIDVIMPNLDGSEVFRHIRQLNPKQPILLISGFVEKSIVSQLLGQPNCRFLNKPFSATGLIRLVNQLILSSASEAEHTEQLATHILLIEDDQLLRMLTASALQERGYSVTEATSGEDAKRRFDEGDYHAILLDLGLPDLPGVQVAEYIRRDARGEAIPILALSGENTAQTRIECTEAGIDDFIAKPFDLEQLDRRLIALTRRVDSQSPTTLDG